MKMAAWRSVSCCAASIGGVAWLAAYGGGGGGGSAMASGGWPQAIGTSGVRLNLVIYSSMAWRGGEFSRLLACVAWRWLAMARGGVILLSRRGGEGVSAAYRPL